MCTFNTIEKKVRTLKSLRAQRDELDTEISKLEEWIKDEMKKQDQYEFKGKDWKVSWNLVSSNRFNQKVFQQELPELFEKYKTLSESRRFNLS